MEDQLKPQRLKARLRCTFAVCLKAYPDTNLRTQILIRTYDAPR
jgi:hypothetical protein